MRAAMIGLVLICHCVGEACRQGTWKHVLLPATAGDLGVRLLLGGSS